MEQDEIYGEFAYVYDEFMDNIPYEQWHDYLHGLLIKYGVTDGIVADLACGTGTMTKLLADDGYDMIGVDMSYEMLQGRSIAVRILMKCHMKVKVSLVV